MVARITGHHASGTGGFPHSDGSELKFVCVGTTSVPSGPSASRMASATACAPPHTQPSALTDVCTSSTLPSRTPSSRRSAARPATVIGAVARRDAPRLAGHGGEGCQPAAQRAAGRGGDQAGGAAMSNSTGAETDFLKRFLPL